MREGRAVWTKEREKAQLQMVPMRRIAERHLNEWAAQRVFRNEDKEGGQSTDERCSLHLQAGVRKAEPQTDLMLARDGVFGYVQKKRKVKRAAALLRGEEEEVGTGDQENCSDRFASVSSHTGKLPPS